jgi:hypothetical protein
MIRLTLRQFRTQAVVAFAGLIVVVLVAGITGPHLVNLYDTTVANCSSHNDCSTAGIDFVNNNSTLMRWLGILVIVVPGIIGIFWGAPLVARELEAGTHRFVWTQSVTRTRWLAVKLGVLGLLSMAVAGILSLVVTWWASPLDRAGMNVFANFDQRDIVPIGYAAFAFALGVLAGLLIRRTLPAIGATLVAFVAARIVFVEMLRPNLIAPIRLDQALNPQTVGFGSMNGGPFSLLPDPPNLPNGWIYTAQIVDKSGHALPSQLVSSVCPQLVASAQGGGPPPGSGHSVRVRAPAGIQQALQDCASKLSATYHELVVYQPVSHYWPLQWSELAVYLGAAFALAGICLWWVRRQIA